MTLDTYTLIIGGGEIGSAIEMLLREKSTVKIYDTDPARSHFKTLTNEVCSEANLLFVCVPSPALPDVLDTFKDFPFRTPLGLLTKGFLPHSHTHAFEAFKEVGLDAVLINGPMIAEEISEGGEGYATIAGSEVSTKVFEEVFEGTQLRTERVEEREAVAVAGILKNIYAIALGALHQEGSNVVGGVCVRMMREAQSILRSNNLVDVSSAYCFLGDVLATGLGENSSNYSTGRRIRAGEVCDFNAEGCRNIKPFIARYAKEDTPIVHAVDALLSGVSFEEFRKQVV